MRKVARLAVGAILLAARLHAQSIASDNAARQRMRDVEQVSKLGHEPDSDKNHTPLLGGPDDDPTLAADTFQHEPPLSARKIASRAEHLSKKQQHARAIEEFQKALQIDPQYYEASNNLALEYFEAGKPELAIETLTRLTKTEPIHVLAFDNLAIIFCRLGRYSEAEAVATRAYKMHPFSYKAAYVFGSSLVSQGKWTPDAKQSLRYASERHPEAKALLAKWPAQNSPAPAQ